MKKLLFLKYLLLLNKVPIFSIIYREFYHPIIFPPSCSKINLSRCLHYDVLSKDNQPISMSRGQLIAKQIWSGENSHRFIVSRIPTNINQVQVVDATPIWYGNNPEIY